MKERKNIIIPAELANRRLDTVLFSLMPEITRSQWQQKIKAQEVFVDLVPAKASYLTKGGEELVIVTEAPRIQDIEPDDSVEFEIVFQNKDLAIIDKPAGLVVHPSDKNEKKTLAHGLLARIPEVKAIGEDPYRPGIVHRLDKDTSGLLVVAKNPEAYLFLKKQFQDRQVRKIYWALVHGKLKEDDQIIDLPIARSKRDPRRRSVPRSPELLSHARQASTKLRVLKRFEKYTLVEAEPITGRTHQIRVHLHALHHPIVGDQLYGGKQKNENLGLKRQFLHAKNITLMMPGEKNLRTFKSDLPQDLRKALQKLA
ncbi:RluA family pseudouridine synthase [Patescibacteria group bacterium]